MSLNKPLYLVTNVPEYTHAADVQKLYAATSHWFADNPHAKDWNVDPQKMIDNILHYRLPKKKHKNLVIDIERESGPITPTEWVTLIDKARSLLPDWKIFLYAFPQVPIDEWKEIIKRAGENIYIYLGVQRNHNHANGVGNCGHLGTLNLIEWALKITNNDPTKILPGTEYWWTDEKGLKWRNAGSLISDVGEMMNQGMPVAVWNPQIRTPLMDEYQRHLLTIVRCIKKMNGARTLLANEVKP